MYCNMEQWLQIRRRVLREGVSKRQILRETGMHWRTLEKILGHASPPGYQRSKPPQKPKIDPYLGRIAEILESDKHIHRKQRHTAKRIWERLQEEGFTGGYTIVKVAVRELKRTGKEVYLPLKHPPGEAQVDFGYALVKMGGVLRKICFFVMALPYSDAFFVRAYERECTETFWDGHVRAFEFFGGVPRRITYDNSRVMISKIVGPRARELTAGFQQLLSHYLFRYHFCLVRRANEKGVVEGLVKYARQNFMVPVPQVRDFDELNASLLGRCQQDLHRRVRGQSQSKKQLLTEEQFSFFGLPFTPFEACRTQPGRVNSELLVRFDDNDYSVPMEYAYQDETSKANTLLERKPHSLAFAKPFDALALSPCFDVLRRRMEAQLEHGRREYIAVLRLLETHSMTQLTRAVEKALRHRVLAKDGLAQFLLNTVPWRQTAFGLAGGQHLRLVQIAKADVRQYAALLGRGGVA